MGGMMAFHEQLARLMDERGISQAELCRATGIATSAMSHYVRGETGPSLTKTVLIADALEVPVDALAGRASEVAYPAGRMSVEPEESGEGELVDIFRSLDDGGRKHLLVYARWFGTTYEPPAIPSK